MKIRRPLTAIAAASLALAIIPTTAHADVNRSGDYTVPAGEVITGDLTVRHGTVTIHGEVQGNVRQKAKGSVIIGAEGKVTGTVWESGKGSVKIHGEVAGEVTETGRGSVRVYGSALDVINESGKGTVRVYPGGVAGSHIWEHNTGKIRVDADATVGGSAIERGPGDVIVRGTVSSGVYESGKGSVDVYGTVGSDEHPTALIMEYAAGSVRIHEGGRFIGESVEERADGELIVDLGAHVSGTINEYGEGSAHVYGQVDGDATESKEGNLYLFATAVVGGDAIERKAGDIDVYEGAVVHGNLVEKGEGDINYR